VASSPFPGWSHGFHAALDRLTIASPRLPRGHIAGPVISRSLGRALEFADHRAYVAGDDLKLVDWRAYNRLDRLYLKQYREERARTITLLVDASASLDWGDAESHKGLYARRLTAALVWIALGRLERAAVFVLRGEHADQLPMPLGRTGVASLLHALAEIHEEGRLSLHDAVREALRAVRGEGPVFLISDLLDPGWAAALQMLARHNQGGAALQVLGPDEWDPPLGDEVELQDSETGELRQTRFGPAERSEYRSRLSAFISEVGDVCRRSGLQHVPLNTGEPFADAVLKRLVSAGVLR
jgi:uncharacterized protein (DUF58 family)